jgi:hypothetical protein
MTVAVKNNNKMPLVVPPAVRRKARFKSGQELEFRVSAGVITIVPRMPDKDGEYTPQQRRAIDTRVAEGLADIKAGRTFGPFNSAGEMIAHMERRLSKRTSAKKTNRLR